MSARAGVRRPRLLSRAEDVHCIVYHVLVVLAYAVAFWVWLHPAAAGLDDGFDRAVFVAMAVPLLGWISGIDVGVNFHNHAHRRTFRIRWLNRWFARQWTVVGGWPHLFWQYLHVRVHHVHLLGEGDWTVPRRTADGCFEPRWRYMLMHWPWRTVVHFHRDIREGRLRRGTALRELAWFAALWSIPFWIDPWMALWLWVLPHWFANCVTLNVGMYVQHAGCETEDARRIGHHSNTFASPFYNLTMFNIGYHAEHHERPNVHWADLPALHAERVAAQPAPDRAQEEVAGEVRR